ncbi:MAG TPA: amino acid adenylation domain-containing protein [Steroidobacteraceae bacterium]|nr:amino acid adenylation domain-containing protein [Steroidobacteraceae bacterium]
MSIRELLERAVECGVAITVSGSDLVLDSCDEIPSDLREEIRKRKTEIIKEIQELSATARVQQPPKRYTRSKTLPLSFAQERLWFLEQLDVGAAYNVPLGARLTGELNFAALRDALNELVRRHEILRTRFVQAAGQPTQVIEAELGVDIDYYDLIEMPLSDRDARIERQVSRQLEIRFDLERGPLFRVCLMRLGTEEHMLLITMHHIVSDGWSMAVLLRELSALYASFAAGRSPQLPALQLQYADYAIWQRETLSGELLDQQLGYWRRQLTAIPAALDLPTDRPRPLSASFIGARHAIPISAALSAALKELALSQGATLFMVLLAAFQIFLGRLSGQKDIVVGSPIAGRTHAGLEELIGFFVNTLVFRLQVDDEYDFIQTIRAVRSITLEAFANQDVPFEAVVSELQPNRTLARQPLYQVAIAVQNVPRQNLGLEGLRVESVGFRHGTAKSDLMLFVFEDVSHINLVFEYATDLFDATTISQWAHSFVHLLQGLVHDPHQPIRSVPVLTDTQRRLQLVTWNDTRLPFAHEECAHHLFEAQAARHPQALAIIDKSGPTTYEQLDESADRLAAYLRSVGVGPEVPVGICLRPSARAVAVLLGVLKCGGVYVPIDLQWPSSRAQTFLARAAVALVISERDGSATLGSIRTLLLEDIEQELPPPGRTREFAESAVSASNAAYLIATSGSSGLPKAVCVQHRSLCNLLHAHCHAFAFDATDRMLQFTRWSFDVSIQEIFVTLVSGACLCIPPEQYLGAELVRYIDEHAITTVMLPSSVLSQLHGRQLPSLRRLFVGGEAFDPAYARYWQERCRFINEYGTTEATVCTSFDELTEHSESVCIGRPIANTKCYVLDEQLEPVPVGAIGELCVAGAGVSRGYLGQPGLTAQKFVADPHGYAGERMYRTGDRVRYRSTGALEFVGRADHQVKIRGHRIELGEIESVLTGLPEVTHAAVTLNSRDASDVSLIAHIVPNAKTLEQIASEQRAGMQKRIINQWLQVFENGYEMGTRDEPDFVGWISSYDGTPIRHEQMERWLENTVSRIKELRPRKLLEVGCGAGLLVRKLAPFCEYYRGLDFSTTAIADLERWLSSQSERPAVELQVCDAGELTDVPGFYDTIVFNSVIQYFPDLEYLAKALRQAVSKLTAGGHIFIGDVRHLGLLQAFHTSVQYHKNRSGPNGIEELRRRIDAAVAAEGELAIDPHFFALLGEAWGLNVAIQLKRGHDDNELTKYRYDVTLEVRSQGVEVRQKPAHCVDWAQLSCSLSGLERHLRETRPEVLRVAAVDNQRLASDLRLAHAIGTRADLKSVREVERELGLEVRAGEEPEEFWKLGERCDYSVTVSFSEADPGQFDVMFQTRTHLLQHGTEYASPCAEPPALDLGEMSSYANSPFAEQVTAEYIQRIKAKLREQLPEYMVPSAVLTLDKMPLNSNGKIDRGKLSVSIGRADNKYEAPRSPIEHALAHIFSEALKVERVGLDDNFFQLGGHSLLATRVLARIRELWKVDLALRSLFEYPTVRSCASQIATLYDAMVTGEVEEGVI